MDTGFQHYTQWLPPTQTASTSAGSSTGPNGSTGWVDGMTDMMGTDMTTNHPATPSATTPYNLYQPGSNFFSYYSNTGSHVPVSRYSSLNGATTSTSTTSAPTTNVVSPQSFYRPFVNPFQTQLPSSPPPSGTLAPQALHVPVVSNASSSSSLSSAMGIAPSMLYSPQVPLTADHTFNPLPSGSFSYSSLHSNPSASTTAPTTAEIPTATSTTSATPKPKTKPIATPPDPSVHIKLLSQYLNPNTLTGAGSLSSLMAILLSNGNLAPNDVDVKVRMEVLTKIRDGAGNPYFRAWVENDRAMECLREWLKSSIGVSKDKDGKDMKETDKELTETIMPLLHIIDRLPLTTSTLKDSKLGKLIVKLVKDSPSPAIKDMASNIETRWRKMVSAGSSAEDDDSTRPQKRRKVGEATGTTPVSTAASGATSASTKSTIPLKRPLPSGTSSGSKAVKKEVVKDPKSSTAVGDSSFFSGPKAKKAKLPSFKKAPVPPPPTGGAVANGGGEDFNNILKDIFEGVGAKGKSGARKESPLPVSSPPNRDTPPPIPTTTTTTLSSKTGKPKKQVTWAAGDRLEMVKWIDRAIYEDDAHGPGMHGGMHGMMFGETHPRLRDEVEKGMGNALHNSAMPFEEGMDWSVPIVILGLPDFEKGAGSVEAKAQEEREKTSLAAFYIGAGQIPDSPAEPDHLPLPAQAKDMNGEPLPEGTDSTTKLMITGPDVEHVFWASEPTFVPPPGFQQPQIPIPGTGALLPSSVADLIAKLGAAAGGGIGLMQNSAAPGIDNIDPSTAQHALSVMHSMGPDSVKALLAGFTGDNNNSNPSELSVTAISGKQPPSNGWEYNDYPSQPYDDRAAPGPWGPSKRGGRGGGGRGGGKGKRRQPCTFYLAGRCKYGDMCDFSHET